LIPRSRPWIKAHTKLDATKPLDRRVWVEVGSEDILLELDERGLVLCEGPVDRVAQTFDQWGAGESMVMIIQ
jgi:hypothetical protein